MIFRFMAKISYKNSQNAFIFLKNLISAIENFIIIDNKLEKNFPLY